MAKRESMKQYADRRSKERENKASEKEAGRISSKAPKNTTKKGADSSDSKGPGPNSWKKGLGKKSGC